MVIGALASLAILYLLLARKRRLRCPHCHEPGVSATKKLLLGPIWTSRCLLCGKAWGTSLWTVPLALLSGLAAAVLVVLNRADLLPFPAPDIVLIMGVLIVDVVIRLHVLPTKKRRS